MTDDERAQYESVRQWEDSSRKSVRGSDPRDYPFAGLGTFLSVVFGIGSTLAFWYVVAHFVVKYW